MSLAKCYQGHNEGACHQPLDKLALHIVLSIIRHVILIKPLSHRMIGVFYSTIFSANAPVIHLVKDLLNKSCFSCVPSHVIDRIFRHYGHCELIMLAREMDVVCRYGAVLPLTRYTVLATRHTRKLNHLQLKYGLGVVFFVDSVRNHMTEEPCLLPALLV